MACKTCKKKKKVTLPKPDPTYQKMTKAKKEEYVKKINRMWYLLNTHNFRSQEGEFVGIYRDVFDINLPTPVNTSTISKFIFEYSNANDINLN